jgi:voltage-gated potassium channel
LRGYRVAFIHFSPSAALSFLFDETVSGRRFEGLCGLFALLSVIVIFIESGAGTQYHLTFDEWHVFVWLELVTLVFTAEYFLRVFAGPTRQNMFQLLGIYRFSHHPAALCHVAMARNQPDYVFAWRAMRVIRVLRILKLLRFMPSLRVFWSAIVSARHQLILFLLVYCHRDDCFRRADVFDRRAQIWLHNAQCVRLLGYCDRYDRGVRRYHTAYAAGAHCGIGADFDWLFGDCYPDGLITTHMSSAFQNRKQQRKCPNCHQGEHEHSARFCNRCGSELPE